MGWASASSIFDKVADALIAAQATDDLKRAVLAPLITELRDGDWDTWDESRERYTNDPTITELFAKLGHDFRNGGVHGQLDFADNVWVLRCDRHGVVGTGEGSAVEHDRLVRVWAQHDRDEHNGDGAVDVAALINPSAVND